LSKAAASAAIAVRSGKITTTAPGRVGAGRMWKVAKSGRYAAVLSNQTRVKAAPHLFSRSKLKKEKKWRSVNDCLSHTFVYVKEKQIILKKRISLANLEN